MFTLENTTKACLIALMTFALFGANVSRAQEFEVEPTLFNSVEADFAPIRYKDGVVFASNRAKKRLTSDTDTSTYYTDMFFSRLLPNNKWTESSLFSNELTGLLNEGPATFTKNGSTIYYTKNFEPKDPSKKVDIQEFKLGIFTASLVNGKWVNNALFPYNSPRSDYNCAHPALAPNDSTLYFASNMVGGIGGIDLYKCIWKDGRWSLPINLGNTINTAADELFPYVSTEGILYFTTNRGGEESNKDMNIYFSEITEEGYSTPHSMAYPINTKFDDYGYSEFTGSMFGFFSSNREKDQDDVYQFRLNSPNFNDCLENHRPIFCYQIKDVKIAPTDSLPLIYEWNLGDGTTKRGLTVDHCYAGVGSYDVKLNIIDSLTNTVFYEVSSATIDIQEYEQPYILSNDSAAKDIPMAFYSDDQFIKQFKVDKRYWIVDNKEHFEGDSLIYAFKEEGLHTVVCGVVGKMDENGKRQKSCAFKQIYVIPERTQTVPLADPDPNAEPVQKIQMHEKVDLATLMANPDLAPLYHIIIAESQNRITFNDPFFSKTRYVIIESKNEDGSYVYTVGNTAELTRLYDMFTELRDSGYTAVKIDQFNKEELKKEFVRTGKFIEPGNADKLNIEFANLKDIKFEYNSDVILEASKPNLDYVAAMLKLENDFDVKINAHTCSMGKHEYNQSLSERRAASVVRYFEEKGIARGRMLSEGFAETQPIATNLTEDGRQENRRVEFIIVFNNVTIASNETK